MSYLDLTLPSVVEIWRELNITKNQDRPAVTLLDALDDRSHGNDRHEQAETDGTRNLIHSHSGSDSNDTMSSTNTQVPDIETVIDHDYFGNSNNERLKNINSEFVKSPDHSYCKDDPLPNKFDKCEIPEKSQDEKSTTKPVANKPKNRPRTLR